MKKKSDPVLVIFVAPLGELARMQAAASGRLPVHRGKVVQSKNVPGLEGVAALSWLDGVDDPKVAELVIKAVKEMMRSLEWSYHLKAEAAGLVDKSLLSSQETLFGE